MSIVTVCIPTIVGREGLLERAVRSVREQTVPCEFLTYHDVKCEGPSVARNRLLAQVKTPFTIFLDDDDYLAPTFVERTLQHAYRTQGYYIYTDWWEHPSSGPRLHTAPDCCVWTDGTWHAVTALLPTHWARAVGGFDETLPALEDTDFWLKIRAYGGCGARLAEPLFHYTLSPNGRSHQAVRSKIVDELKRDLLDKYKGVTMPCCTGTVKSEPTGERQPNDVLATPVFGGRMKRIGKATGRMYPYSGPGDYVWVDPRDVPIGNEWRLVNTPLSFSEAAEQLSEYMRTLGEKSVGQPVSAADPDVSFKPKPDLTRLKHRKGKKNE